jgi:hypothetical protein
VPDRLTHPHPFDHCRAGSAAKRETGHVPVQKYGQQQEVLRNEKPDTYQYKSTVSSRWSSLDIRVAPANVARALRFLDTLFKALIARGHAVEIRERSTVALVGVEDFKLQFREKMKR